jgi:hypothetical protein
MSALGNHYRWQVYNGTGSTVTVTLDAMLWKFGTDGSLTFSAESTPISASALTTLTYGNSSGVSNASDKYIGAQLTALFDVSGSTTGAVSVFLQQSTDAGTTWPSDGQGLLVGSYYFNASSTDALKNFVV